MTQPRSRVDLYAAIRRDARSGMSNRALQRKHGVGFRTVTAALESAWPKERKQLPKRGSRLDAYRVVIDDWLRSDLDAPRKQRHTAKRIFDRLLDEHDGAGVVSYWMVREYVATRRREIRVEVGREPANAFIPQEHLPGREAEVDFGDVAIRLRGELVTCALFSLRLSYSGKAVHRPIDRTNGCFCADPRRGGWVVRHASVSLMMRREGRWCRERGWAAGRRGVGRGACRGGACRGRPRVALGRGRWERRADRGGQ